MLIIPFGLDSEPGLSQHKDKLSEVEDTSGSRTVATDHVDRVLAEWAQVRGEHDLTPVGVIARLGRTTAYIDAAINTRLAEFGLSRGSWDVLASLRRTGSPYRLSPTQLYQALMRTSGAMTHRLSRLERAGLITRLPDPEDRRGMLVQLTLDGVRLVDQVAPAHLTNERSLLAALSIEEQNQLADLLRKMLAAFEREQPTPPPSRRRRRRCHSTQRERLATEEP